VRLAPDGWRDTAVVLDDVPDGAMNALDGAPAEVGAGRTSLAVLCGTLPLALAWADTTMRANVPLYP
jgi:(1->4)-alpha-D-glucan 1-alpha-D-glucosylmutase